MIDSLEELEDFVPFDDAILLREYGFDAEGVGSAHGIYNPDGGVDYDDLNNADLVYPDKYPPSDRPYDSKEEFINIAAEWLYDRFTNDEGGMPVTASGARELVEEFKKDMKEILNEK